MEQFQNLCSFHYKLIYLKKIISMLRKYAFFSIVMLLWSCNSYKNITQVSFQKFENKVVEIDYSNNIYSALCEPSIVIDKKKPTHIIVGSVYNNVYNSNNQGINWDKNKLSSDFGVYGDPCLASDNKGHLYYLHLSRPDINKVKNSYLIDRIVIQSSIDGGKTWSKGVGIGYNPPKQQDKHWVGIDPKTGSLAVTWTEFDMYESTNPNDHSRILFSRSDDFGNTWTSPVELSQFEGDCSDSDGTTEGAVPVFDNNGNIYVSWAYNDKIYFDKSIDGGKTWLKQDVVVANQPGGWEFDIPGIYRCNGLPVLAIDNSKGIYSGNLYVNWTDQRNGKDNTDVFIAKSTDKGKTWSNPIKVNQDNTKTHQFLTWLSVDPITGYLYIIYNDRSKYTDNKTEVVLARSTDGGNSFVTKTISNRYFVPVKEAFFGDYNNIDAYNGIVATIWTEMTNKRISINTTTLNFNTKK